MCKQACGIPESGAVWQDEDVATKEGVAAICLLPAGHAVACKFAMVAKQGPGHPHAQQCRQGPVHLCSMVDTDLLALAGGSHTGGGCRAWEVLQGLVLPSQPRTSWQQTQANQAAFHDSLRATAQGSVRACMNEAGMKTSWPKAGGGPDFFRYTSAVVRW